MDVIGVNVGGFSNWLKLNFAKCVVEKAFNEFINTQMSELYLSIYKKCAQNPNCISNCFQTIPRKDNWCVSCICLKDEILKSCRHRHFPEKIYWKSFEYDKLMSSSKELTKIFLPDWNINTASRIDLSSMLTLFHNCNKFDMIPINIIQDVKRVRNKYLAHNTTICLSEYEFKKCLNRLYVLTRVIEHTHSGQKAYQDLQDVEILDVVEFLKRETNGDSILEHIENQISLLQDATFQEQMLPDQINILSAIGRQIKRERRKYAVRKKTCLVSYFIQLIFIFLYRGFKTIFWNVLTPVGIVLACLVFGWILMPQNTRRYNHSCASMKYSYPWNSEIFFGGYNRDHKHFTGRKWLYNDLERYILKSSRGVIVSAEMGYGKTALVANILCSDDERTSAGRIRDQILAFHMCKFDVLSTQKPAVFIRNVVGKIAREIPEFGNIILTDDTILQFLEIEKCSEDPYACIDFGLIHPLNQLSSVPGKVLLLIEALDECDELVVSKTHTIVTILRRKLADFPRWLTFVFISRNIPSLLSKFSSLHQYVLDSQDKRNIDDIKHFIHTRINMTGPINDSYGYTISEVEEKLTNLSKGNFLFVIHALQHWAFSSNSSIYDIPVTLRDIYQNNFERAFGIDGAGFENARMIFEILSSTYYPVSQENLLEIAKAYSNISDTVFFRLIRGEIGHFLTDRTGYIQISHKSVQDWLLQNDKAQSPFYISKENGHRIFCNYMFRQFQNTSHWNVFDIFTLAVHIAESNDKHFRNMFLEHFKNLPQYNRSIEPFIHLFARQINHYEGMKLLIQITPEHIDIRNEENVTAVFIAAQHGHSNSLNALLDKGANTFCKVESIPLINYFNDAVYFAKNVFLWGYNPLHIAAQNNHKTVVKSLLKRDQSLLLDTNDIGLNPFQSAAERGNIDIQKMFLDINASLVDDHSLYYSTLNGHLSTVDLLLKNGWKDKCLPCNGSLYWIKPNSLRFQGETITKVIHSYHSYLNYSQYNGDLSTLSNVLIDDWRLLTCESCIHAAVRMGHIDIVKRLIMHSKDTLECRDKDGMTPLFYAIKFNHTGIFELLVENGANLLHVCDGNISVSDADRMLLNEHELSLIEVNLCSKRLHIAHLLAIYNRFPMGSHLVKNQFTDWNSLDSDNLTALHYAACHSSLEMIILLHKIGLKNDSRSSNGSTPFHSAVACQSNLGLMMLNKIYSGNPKDLKDNDGLDLFHYAFLNPLKDTPQDDNVILNNKHLTRYIYHDIFTKQYNFSQTDNHNNTALQYGIRTGFYRSVELICLYYGHENVVQWKTINNGTYLDLAFQSLPDYLNTDTSTLRREINNDLIYVVSPYDINVILFIRIFAQHNMGVLQKNMQDYVHFAAEKGRYYVLMELKRFDDLNVTDKGIVTVLLHGVSPVLLYQVKPSEVVITELVPCGKNETKYPLHEIVMNKNNSYWYYSPAHGSFLDQVLSNFTAEELDHCYDNKGYNLLHRSVMGGHVAAVKFFIRKGMNLTIKADNRDALIFALLHAPYSSYLSSLFANLPIKNTYNIDYYNHTKLVQSTVIVNNSTETINYKATSLLILHHLGNRSKSSLFCKPRFRELSSVHIAAAKGFTELISEMYEYFGVSVLRCKNADRFTPLYLAKLFNQSETVDFISKHVTLESPLELKDAILITKLLFSFEHPFSGDNTLLNCIYKKEPLPLWRAVTKKWNCLKLVNAEMEYVLNKNNSGSFDTADFKNSFRLDSSGKIADFEINQIRTCLLIPKFYYIYMKSPLSFFTCRFCPGTLIPEYLYLSDCLRKQPIPRSALDIIVKSSKNPCSFRATSFEFCYNSLMHFNSVAVQFMNLYINTLRIAQRKIKRGVDLLFQRRILDWSHANLPFFLNISVFINNTKIQNLSLDSYLKSVYLNVLKIKK